MNTFLENVTTVPCPATVSASARASIGSMSVTSASASARHRRKDRRQTLDRETRSAIALATPRYPVACRCRAPIRAGPTAATLRPPILASPVCRAALPGPYASSIGAGNGSNKALVPSPSGCRGTTTASGVAAAAITRARFSTLASGTSPGTTSARAAPPASAAAKPQRIDALTSAPSGSLTTVAPKRVAKSETSASRVTTAIVSIASRRTSVARTSSSMVKTSLCRASSDSTPCSRCFAVPSAFTGTTAHNAPSLAPARRPFHAGFEGHGRSCPSNQVLAGRTDAGRHNSNAVRATRSRSARVFITVSVTATGNPRLSALSPSAASSTKPSISPR